MSTSAFLGQPAGRRVRIGLELEPEALERHREARIRADDEHDFHELTLVEVLGQARPRVVTDPEAIDQLLLSENPAERKIAVTPANTKPDTLLALYNQGVNTALAFARPLSQHPTGFMVAFCDGHTKFVSESISYETYARLMTHNGKKYQPAGIPLPLPTGQAQVLQMQMLPVTDGQY
jgi:prepilin-type processing-associated H-X9-DG protein